MKCHTCGRQIQNEAANFCEYCGASFREQAQTTFRQESGAPFYYRQLASEQASDSVSGFHQSGQQNMKYEKPISFLEWIGFYAVLLVPILNIVLLAIWAFSYNTPDNKKNWARATLVFIVVVFLLLVVILVQWILYTINTPMFQEMMQQYGGSIQ
jgi:hypothetical protein